MKLTELLRLGAQISRDRSINLDYAKVADQAADEIDRLTSELSRLTDQEPVGYMDNDGNISDNDDYGCFPIKLYENAGVLRVTDGYQVVPIEPTTEMLEMGSIASDYDCSQSKVKSIWKQMLITAQKETA